MLMFIIDTERPGFSATALLFSTKNSSLWETRGHRLHFCVLVEQSIRFLAEFETCPLFFPSSWLSRPKALNASDLWLTALPPSKLNSHLQRIQNNLRWMKWQDLYYRWAFSIPSKWFHNEFLDSVWSCMSWSYWVIISSETLWLCQMPQRKSDQYTGNTSGQVRKSNGSWESVELVLIRPDKETTKTMRTQQWQFLNLQKATTDGTWGSGIFDEKSSKWGLLICIKEEKGGEKASVRQQNIQLKEANKWNLFSSYFNRKASGSYLYNTEWITNT